MTHELRQRQTDGHDGEAPAQAHGSPLRGERLVQARARNGAIQRKALHNLPSGAGSVRSLDGDAGPILSMIDSHGGMLASAVGAIAPDFEGWGWAQAIEHNLGEGELAQDPMRFGKTMVNATGTARWSLKIDFSLADVEKSRLGKGASKSAHTKSRSKSASRGKSSGAGGGFSMNRSHSSGNESTVGGESGMDLGLEGHGAKVGLSSKQSSSTTSKTDDSSGHTMSNDWNSGTTSADTDTDTADDHSESDFAIEKIAKRANVYAAVTLTLDWDQSPTMELYGLGEPSQKLKRSFFLAVGSVLYQDETL